jgi:hypothetical protein
MELEYDLLDRLTALLRDPVPSTGGTGDALLELRQLVLAGGGLPPHVASTVLAPGCSVRAAVWRLLLGSLPAAGDADRYFALVARGPSRCADKIAQDVGRTLRGDPQLRDLAPEDARTRLLNAFVHHCDHGAEAAAESAQRARAAHGETADRGVGVGDVTGVTVGDVVTDADPPAPSSQVTVLGTRADAGSVDSAGVASGRKRERDAGVADAPLPQQPAAFTLLEPAAPAGDGDSLPPPTATQQQQPSQQALLAHTHKRSRSSGDASAAGGGLDGAGTGGPPAAALAASPSQPVASRAAHLISRSSGGGGGGSGHRRAVSGASSGTALSGGGSSLGGDFAVSTLTTTSSVGTVAGGSRGEDETSGTDEAAAAAVELPAEGATATALPPVRAAGAAAQDATPSSSVPSHFSTPASQGPTSTTTTTATATTCVHSGGGGGVGDSGSAPAGSRSTAAPAPHHHCHHLRGSATTERPPPPSVCGYSQGMGSHAGVLLSVLPEPDAFAALVALVLRGVPGLYDARQRGVREGCALADALLLHADPVVHGRLLAVYGPFSSHAELMFFSRVASLYAHRPPLGTIARLWDVILAGGAHFVPLLCAAEAVLRRDELLAAGRNAITRFQGIGRGEGVGGGSGGGGGGGEGGVAAAGDAPPPPAPGGWLPPADDLLATAFGLLHELPPALADRLHAFARRVSPWPPLPAPATSAADAGLLPERVSREASNATDAAAHPVAAAAALSPATDAGVREPFAARLRPQATLQPAERTGGGHSLSAVQLPSPPLLLLPAALPVAGSAADVDAAPSPPSEPFPSPPPAPPSGRSHEAVPAWLTPAAAPAEVAPQAQLPPSVIVVPMPRRVDKPRAHQPSPAEGGGVSTTSPLAATLGGSSGGSTGRGALAAAGLHTAPAAAAPRPRPLLTRAAPGTRSEPRSPRALTPASAPPYLGGGVHGGVHTPGSDRAGGEGGVSAGGAAYGAPSPALAGAGRGGDDESVASATATPPPPASLRARVSGAIAEHVDRMRRSSAGRQRRISDAAGGGGGVGSPFTSPRPPAAAVFAGPLAYCSRRSGSGVSPVGRSTAGAPAPLASAAPGHRRHHTVQAGALQEAVAPLRASRTAAGARQQEERSGSASAARSRSAAAAGGGAL